MVLCLFLSSIAAFLAAATCAILASLFASDPEGNNPRTALFALGAALLFAAYSTISFLVASIRWILATF